MACVNIEFDIHSRKETTKEMEQKIKDDKELFSSIIRNLKLIMKNRFKDLNKIRNPNVFCDALSNVNKYVASSIKKLN